MTDFSFADVLKRYGAGNFPLAAFATYNRCSGEYLVFK